MAQKKENRGRKPDPSTDQSEKYNNRYGRTKTEDLKKNKAHKRKMINDLVNYESPEDLKTKVMENVIYFLENGTDRYKMQATELVFKALFPVKKQVDTTINTEEAVKVFVVPSIKDYEPDPDLTKDVELDEDDN